MTGLTTLIVNKPVNCNKIDEELSKWTIWKPYKQSQYSGFGIVRIGKCTFKIDIMYNYNKCFSSQCKSEVSLPKPVLAFISLDFYASGGPTTLHLYLDDVFVHGPMVWASYNYQVMGSFQKIKVTMSGATKPFRHVVITVTVLDVLEGGEQ